MNNISDPNPPVSNRLHKGSMKRKKPNSLMWIGVAFVSIILVAITVYYFFIFKGDLFSTSIKGGQDKVVENPKSFNDDSFLTAQIHIFDKEKINTKELKIAINPVTVIMIESAINEILKNLPEDLKGIQLINVLKDKDNVLYLDFNGDLRHKTRFDVNEEYLFLKTLYQTIFVNFKAITNVRILIEGKEIETISGHIDISKGIKGSLE